MVWSHKINIILFSKLFIWFYPPDSKKSWVRLSYLIGRGRIPVGSLDDSTWDGRTTAAPLGPPDDWGAQDIQDKFPGGKTTAVPGGGMPGGV